MRDWTYLELKTKVETDLDLQQNSIISAPEMLGYCNEAIDEAEAEIHKLGIEDIYFLSYANLALTNGIAEYNLPADIYANKIEGVIYKNGVNIYEVKRLRARRKFLELAEINAQPSSTDLYQYLLINRSRPDPLVPTSGRKLQLIPAAQETSTNITLWYIRNAASMSADTDTLDIPEFANFIISFMKCRCLQKEGDPRAPDEVAVLAQQRKLMIDTLTEMVPDGDTEIEQDLSHYQEMT
jgi:hypothetical protein